MTALIKELNILCAKKLDLDTKVMEEMADSRKITIVTANWWNSIMELIKGEEMKKLMKEERVAEIVVKMIEQPLLRKLWQEDREIFDIVVHVVKKKCNQEIVGGEIDAEEDADYKKVAKIASNVLKDIAEEFKDFIKRDGTTVAVVKLLNNDDLEKLRRGGNEMDEMLRKAEDIILKEAELNDHNEEELPLPKHDKDVQLVNQSIIKEKVGGWRKRMGSLMTFLDDESFKKGLPDGALLGLEVLDVLSKSSGSHQVEEICKSHRYCGWCAVRLEVYRHRHDMNELAEIMVQPIKCMIDGCPLGSEPLTRRKRPDELENIPVDFMDGLESREEVLRKILIDLNDDQVNIVGVYGMGGCGKTTLVKEIAHKRAIDLFSKRVVVEVSEVPNIKGIQNQIAGGIGLTLDDMHTIAERARILYNQLKLEKNKILIILDNVWNKLKLYEVGIPHGSTEDFCCKLLITTREKQVCRLMDVQEANIFKVGLLNKKEALNLFENQTEKKVGSGEFKAVADRLLRKCGGLPLAIATTASALRGKDLPMWCHFAETSEKPISSQISTEYRET
ncbi:putative disease resistance protein At4g14610 isoform X2 [Silene latifolia]